ncbi:MAG: hypothetical protein HHAS10_04060 [Candidatus Altimarinota bacterium]
MIIIKLFLILLFLSFPILLWGYGTLYLSKNVWNKNRFLFGMLGGSIAVAIISFFGKESISGGNTLQIISFVGIFFIIGVLVWWATRKGSPFIRGFLRKAILLHSGIFCFIFIISILLSNFFEVSHSLMVLLSGVGSVLIAASLEEGVKHISTLGLTAKEFRFTRRDFLLFTFFVTLGFATSENAIYLFQNMNLSVWSIAFIGISRILFSLTLHVFAASICVMMWWKALSYKFMSFEYILLFLAGYITAILIHGTFNIFLERSYVLPLVLLTGFGYFSFTQWILDENEK